MFKFSCNHNCKDLESTGEWTCAQEGRKSEHLRNKKHYMYYKEGRPKQNALHKNQMQENSTTV